MKHPLASHPRLASFAAHLDADTGLNDGQRMRLLNAAAADAGVSQLDVELDDNPSFIAFGAAPSGTSDDFRELVAAELRRLGNTPPMNIVVGSRA